MGNSPKKDARDLYASGMSVEDIAEAVGKSTSTVYRWRDADGDWDKLRQFATTADLPAVCARIKARIAAIAEDTDLEAGAYADALQKLTNVLDKIESRIGNLSTVLGVLHAMALWARDSQSVSDADLVVLSRLTEAYTRDLQEENS